MSAEEKTYAEALGAGDPSGSSGESERISTTGDQSGRSSERLEAPSVAGPRSSGDQQDGSGSLGLMRPGAAAAASLISRTLDFDFAILLDSRPSKKEDRYPKEGSKGPGVGMRPAFFSRLTAP